MKILSLFANVGFGEFYLAQNGYDVVVANELLPERADFYNKIHKSGGEMICGDICSRDIRLKIIQACKDAGPIDAVIATPPCQGMSIANAQKKPDDIRNTLIVHAMDIFNEIGAKHMLIENVTGMLKTSINYEGNVVKIKDFIDSSIPHTHKCVSKVLDGKHFGTPQSRRRAICLISPNGNWKHPEQSKEILTVRDAIGNINRFPSLESECYSLWPWHFSPRHNDRHIKWMKNTPEGETAFNNEEHFPSVEKNGVKRRIFGYPTTYKRMKWDEPAPTVTMNNGSISSQNNVHPGRQLINGDQSDARVLSVREILAICGLPPNCLDSFATPEEGGTYKYEYNHRFIRDILGEMFLPKLCLKILQELKDD